MLYFHINIERKKINKKHCSIATLLNGTIGVNKQKNCALICIDGHRNESAICLSWPNTN